MDWIAAVLIIAGNYLLARKNTVGWVCSIVGSAIMIFYFIPQKTWSMVALNVIFLGQSVYGLIRWKRNDNV